MSRSNRCRFLLVLFVTILSSSVAGASYNPAEHVWTVELGSLGEFGLVEWRIPFTSPAENAFTTTVHLGDRPFGIDQRIEIVVGLFGSGLVTILFAVFQAIRFIKWYRQEKSSCIGSAK